MRPIPGNQARPPRFRPFTGVALALAVAALSLLLWSRLKLVAGVPRSVYADPNPAKGPVKGKQGAPSPKE